MLAELLGHVHDSVLTVPIAPLKLTPGAELISSCTLLSCIIAALIIKLQSSSDPKLFGTRVHVLKAVEVRLWKAPRH